MSRLSITNEETEINWQPLSVAEEIYQNIYMFLSLTKGEVPFDRQMGIDSKYIDKDYEFIKQTLLAELYTDILKYEPRLQNTKIKLSMSDMDLKISVEGYYNEFEEN